MKVSSFEMIFQLTLLLSEDKKETEVTEDRRENVVLNHHLHSRNVVIVVTKDLREIWDRKVNAASQESSVLLDMMVHLVLAEFLEKLFK